MALFGRCKSQGTVEVPVLRTRGLASRTIARHVVHMQRTYAVEVHASLVHVTDAAISAQMAEALAAESFVRTDGGWWAAPIARQDTPDSLAVELASNTEAPTEMGLLVAAEQLRTGLVRELAMELERCFAPMKIEGAPLPHLPRAHQTGVG